MVRRLHRTLARVLLFGRCRNRSPVFRSEVSYVLRIRPPVALMILRCVLPFAERHVIRLLNDTRATLPGMLEVPDDVRNGDVHVLGNGICLRGAKRTTLSTKHDGAFDNCQLRVTNNAVSFST